MGNVRAVRCFATSASRLLQGPGSGFKCLEARISCPGHAVYQAKCPDLGFLTDDRFSVYEPTLEIRSRSPETQKKMRVNAPPNLSLSDAVFTSRKSRHADPVCLVPEQRFWGQNPCCEILKPDRNMWILKKYAQGLGPEYMETVPDRRECSETPKHKTQ